MDGDIVFLDLNKVTLLGFERKNLFSKVEKMVAAIESGDENFPAVPVKRLDNSTYALTHQPSREGCADGGHHRAIAHYIANHPLKCTLVEEDFQWNCLPNDNWGLNFIRYLKRF